MTPNPFVAITKSYFQRISNRPQTTHKPPQTLPQDPKISKPARAQTHPRESQRLWGKSRVGWGGSWCEALSFDSASGGALRALLGGPPASLFFDLNPKFSMSKPPPETKASEYLWFQTMRISIFFVIFLCDHGINPAETHFGPLLGSFWGENMKNN